jgi:hypothetical protein
MDYPQTLQPWLHRRVWRGTLAAVRDLVAPAFVKPSAQVKLFDGRIMEPTDAGGSRHAPDTAVWFSDVVTWRGEWRVYVSAGSVIGAFPYRGDWRVMPAWPEVDAMVAAWSTAPRGYALDIGVLADGRTALIEANDAWALGNYGLLPAAYAQLLRARWNEIVGSEWSSTGKAFTTTGRSGFLVVVGHLAQRRVVRLRPAWT